MKQLIKLPAIILGLVLLFSGPPQKAMAQQYDDISMDSFYDELSPYGTWMNDPQYGRVWRPDVDQDDFRPYYSNGRWAMTEYGNTWVSDYDWGWAPFHYGRWVMNSYNQWLWIPDTVWGPAWVSWRSGGGYYGWAPLGPGMNININIGGGYNMPNSWWSFIPQASIYSNYYPRYTGININIFNRTRYINYTSRRDRHTYYTGPRASEIRRVTKRDVRVYEVSRSNRPGRTSISNNRVNIYNPGVSRGRANATNNRDMNRTNNSGREGTVNPGRTNRQPGTVDQNRTGQQRASDARRSSRQGQDAIRPGADQQRQADQRQRQQQDQQRQNMQRRQDQQNQQRQQDVQRQQMDRQRQVQQDQQRQAQQNQQRQQQEVMQRQQQDQQRQRQQQDQQRQSQQNQQRQQQEAVQRQQNQQRQEQSRSRVESNSNRGGGDSGRSGGRGGRGN